VRRRRPGRGRRGRRRRAVLGQGDVGQGVGGLQCSGVGQGAGSLQCAAVCGGRHWQAGGEIVRSGCNFLCLAIFFGLLLLCFGLDQNRAWDVGVWRLTMF
jgi:hypothetical protein